MMMFKYNMFFNRFGSVLQQDIAKMFGVSVVTISKIMNNKSWRVES